MLYYDIYDNLTTEDTILTIKCLEYYCTRTENNGGIIDILGLWDPNPRMSDEQRKVRMRSFVSQTIECLEDRQSLTGDQLLCIYRMFQYANDQFKVTRGGAGMLLTEKEYAQATKIVAVVYDTYAESHVALNTMALLADAMLGHFGADSYDTDRLHCMMDYCKRYMPVVDEWCALVACAMVHTNKRTLSAEVFEIADNLYEVLNK